MPIPNVYPAKRHTITNTVPNGTSFCLYSIAIKILSLTGQKFDIKFPTY